MPLRSVLFAAALAAAAYDPLATPPAAPPPSIELTAHDPARQRSIPLRVYLPSGSKPAPAILFSHGLGGSRNGSSYLGKHWAPRGYVAVFLQHPGSDEAVWRDAAPRERMNAMRQAANAKNLLLRVRDVHAAIDRLGEWNAQPGHPLRGRIDLQKIGLAGHSFGAVTTQAVSGQTAAGFTDRRVKAALVLSPSSPRRSTPAEAFGNVSIPWMLMTGTRDVGPLGDQTVESRLQVFPALPAGSKYELVLDGGEHSAFTDRAGHPEQHRKILALSTAFWDAYLRGDELARAWLDGPGARAAIGPSDRWRTK